MKWKSIININNEAGIVKRRNEMAKEMCDINDNVVIMA